MSEIRVLSRTQRIVVDQGTSEVSVVNAGPVGPPGVEGQPGPPGVDAQTSVGLVMTEHVNSPTPHPAYDDIPDLTTLLENGLL